MLIGTWLLAIGVPFAIWPNTASKIADYLRLQPRAPVTRQQSRYARRAGIAIATLGMLVLLVTQIHQHAFGAL